MALIASLVTVGSSTPVQLDAASGEPVGGTSSVWITVGAADIYLGGSNAVTASGATRGRLVKAGTDLTLDLEEGEHLWAITATGSSICEIAQLGV